MSGTAQDTSIAAMRARVAALVEEEAALLAQAMALGRGGDPRRVDALFCQVQALQLERQRLKKQIGDALGNHRMHVAREVWKPGEYDWRESVDGTGVRVRVVAGALGLQVLVPGRGQALSIDDLEGTFDGPFAADPG